jgi:DMSO/TMAO reductase YedYZ molybdopterin-dependent catalytic subunit
MKTRFLTTATLIISVIASTVLVLIPVAGSVDSPSAEVPEWQLSISGFVDNPLNLSWAEIVAMPQSTVYAEIICVDFPDQVSMAGNWTGVQLRLVLETAGISPEAVKVGFRASDNFITDLSLETTMRGDVLLAYELNGEPLPEVLRLVVPGKWGYKWIHHVNQIELLNYDFLGFWESRGYSDEAEGYASDFPSIPQGNIPEFPSILPLALATLLIAVLATLMKKKIQKSSTQTLPS